MAGAEEVVEMLTVAAGGDAVPVAFGGVSTVAVPSRGGRLGFARRVGDARLPPAAPEYLIADGVLPGLALDAVLTVGGSPARVRRLQPGAAGLMRVSVVERPGLFPDHVRVTRPGEGARNDTGAWVPGLPVVLYDGPCAAVDTGARVPVGADGTGRAAAEIEILLADVAAAEAIRSRAGRGSGDRATVTLASGTVLEAEITAVSPQDGGLTLEWAR